MMILSLKLYSDKPQLLNPLGRWALQDGLKPKNVKITDSETNQIGVADIEVKCDIDFILHWLEKLPKTEVGDGEELVDVGINGNVNLWAIYDILTHIKRLGFPIEEHYANVKGGIEETDFDFSFQVPVSYFIDQLAESTQVAAVSVTKESAQKKNEAPSTENEMLKKLKAIIQQSKSELDMIKNIALFLKFDLQDTELLRRAYVNYQDLSKKENKQLRDALSSLFNRKRLDHTMKELKKLFDQSQTVAAEFPDSQEVTAATSVPKVSSETTSASTHTSPVHYDFDNVRDEEPTHTEEGQKGDGDDTSSEEDAEEEDPHT